YIVPTMEEWEVYPRVAAAVAVKAVEQGFARKTTTYKEELENSTEIILLSRKKLETILEKNLIKDPLAKK
ncbi:MAG: malate dehydrogenase, partial [Caldisphaera sp.]